MIRYTTVAGEGYAEYTVEKSKFYAHIARADSKAAAEEYIYRIRSEYKDATHNVPAYIIGEKQELMWASDDGEPSGTSGPPVMQMLAKEGLTNVCIVITRYFGGIKLGTGGLVRAYTEAAAMALSYAGRHEARDAVRESLRIPYSVLPRLENVAEEQGFFIENTSYDDAVNLDIIFDSEREERINALISDYCSGKEIISKKIPFIY